MNYSSLLVIVGPFFFTLLVVLSICLWWSDSTPRTSANSLVVLSGTLAALAIFIPLAATFLPSAKFGWQAWLLAGSLIAAILCIFMTMFSMIKLQTRDTFEASQFLYVPASINATWITMALLSFAILSLKFWPPNDQQNNYADASQARFTIARHLPDLGTSQKMIKELWGTPAQERSSELLYRTKDGVIVFCLDSQGMTQSIIETKETTSSANKPLCATN